jgi:TRAP-type mannitol/chloroaromatic compound transport system permease small subunit
VKGVLRGCVVPSRIQRVGSQDSAVGIVVPEERMDEATAVSNENIGVEQPGRYTPMTGLGTLGRVLDGVFTAAGYLSGLLFLVLAVFVTYDVIARKWGVSLHLPTTRVTDEISGYILALAATWGLAYTLRTDAHVRIDVLLPYLPRRYRVVADLLAVVLMGFFAGLVSWKIWALVLDSFESGIRSSTYLLTPQWIPEGIVGIGFSLLTLASAAMAVSMVTGWRLVGAAATATEPNSATSDVMGGKGTHDP